MGRGVGCVVAGRARERSYLLVAPGGGAWGGGDLRAKGWPGWGDDAMTCSPARLAANRANALLSTGPRTGAGKAASRGNALKHGLAGAGVVLPAADRAEVDRLRAAFERELGPKGEVAVALVHRAAVLAARLDRCGRQELAALADRVRTAEADFDSARLDEVDRLMVEVVEAPARALRALVRMPEGVDRLLETWRGLRADLEDPAAGWTPRHRAMAEALSGRGAGAFGPSVVARLAEAATAGPAEERAWARGELLARIDEAVGRLVAVRDGFDPGELALSRAGAADRALFDPSGAASLARRYEAAAERGLFRAYRELREIEGGSGHDPAPGSGPNLGELARGIEAARVELARVEGGPGRGTAGAEGRADAVVANPGPAGAAAVAGVAAGLGSSRAEADRASRPDPAKLKRALKADRRSRRAEARRETPVPVPALAGGSGR